MQRYRSHSDPSSSGLIQSMARPIRAFNQVPDDGYWRFLPVRSLRQCENGLQRAELITIRRLIDVVNMNGLLAMLQISSVHGRLFVNVAAKFLYHDQHDGERPATMNPIDRWERDMRYVFSEVFEFGNRADRPSVNPNVRGRLRDSSADDRQVGMVPVCR